MTTFSNNNKKHVLHTAIITLILLVSYTVPTQNDVRKFQDFSAPFFFLCMRLRPIVGQPGSSIIISRVKLGQTTVQLHKRAGFDDVGHRLGLTTEAQISLSTINTRKSDLLF